MTIDDIKALIAADESRTLELKKTTGELTVCTRRVRFLTPMEAGWFSVSRRLD